MPQFTDFISDALVRQGYKLLGKSDGDVFLLEPDIYRTTLEQKSIWICYLDREVTPEQIRRMFDFKGYVLIAVNEKLIPDNVASRQQTPMWLRVLHGLYMGRIYAWNGRSVFGLHIDYDTGDVSESPALQPTSLLLLETGTWLRGWNGNYKLARFYDNAWWEVRSRHTDEQWTTWTKRQKPGQDNTYQQAKEEPRRWKYEYENQWTPPGDSGYQSAGYQDYKQQSSSRQSYEQSRDSYWQQQQAREKAQRDDASSHSGYWKEQGQTYDAPWAKQTPPKQKPPKQNAPRLKTKQEYIADFKACGNYAAAKKLFNQLLRENHPDLNPGKLDATKIMQEINPAWEYMKDWWT